MRNRLLSVFAVVAAVLFTSGPAAWAGESQPSGVDAKALIDAAHAAKVPINVEEIVSATSKNVTFVGTSIAGFEQVPATEFPNGTDVAFAYVDFPAAGIPAGYYRLKTHAASDDVTVGAYPGTTEFISLDGKVVARLPSSIDTHSLEVPNPLPFPRTVVEASIDEVQAWKITITVSVTVRCPNGSTITVRVSVTIRG
ncbi:hypothetical protein [Myxococcus qinghaiensis]|uniref:hypothetical protein n=1 Tax=Myxococcus qinghaiensis TaxID=2906758 RepID=UPI0020A74F93|nr:hypothetical protein [Myxococcus qinghaiensis]MCP3162138.1 hypothetical protein [Myxococcus qinghaiensis]